MTLVGSRLAASFGMLVMFCSPSDSRRFIEPASPGAAASTQSAPFAGCWVPGLSALTPVGERFRVSDPKVFVAVPRGAPARVREVAGILSKQLERLSGRVFSVREAQPEAVRDAIVVATADQVAQAVGTSFANLEGANREAFLIRSEKSRLLLVAATEQGLEPAVWDFLNQLGYRQYFPGAVWEVVPRLEQVDVQTDRYCRPAWRQRKLWYHFGDWPENSQDLAWWSRVNRLGGTAIEVGHAYEAIVRARRKEFESHPQYLSKTSTWRRPKFCVTAPGLENLVIDYAQNYLASRPERSSISLEPSDGGGWEGCPSDDAQLGSPSNRVIHLANAVAQAINLGSARPRFVGVYAYSQHAQPPTLRVHPNVVVFVASRFLPTGTTIFDLMNGWQAAGSVQLGVREYYSVNAWDRDRPGVAAASSPHDVASSVRRYYDQGARYFSAEAGDGWGPHGLGYWVAAASLWTSNDPVASQRYVDDFLHGAFDRAAGVMAEFYARIDGKNRPLLSRELVGELSRILVRARDVEQSASVRRRVEALALYVRYLDLWLDYEFAEPNDRQDTFSELIRYAHRIRRQHMVHSYGLYRDLPARDRALVPPELSDEAASKPEATDLPVDAKQLDAWTRAGARREALPRALFSDEAATLVRLRSATLPSSETRDARWTTMQFRGRQKLQVVFDAARQFPLRVRGGVVQGDARIEVTLCRSGSAKSSCQTLIAPADRSDHELVFEVSGVGRYELAVEDFKQGVRLSWPMGTPVSFSSTERPLPALWHRWTLYFYVPRGVREVVMYSTGGLGTLRNPEGDAAHTFDRRPGLVRVRVPAGMDGRCWKFDSNMGVRLLLNVPPWLAASPEELLVPAGALP